MIIIQKITMLLKEARVYGFYFSLKLRSFEVDLAKTKHVSIVMYQLKQKLTIGDELLMEPNFRV